MTKKIAIIGAGNVGISLAQLFINNNHTIVLGSRNPERTKSKISALFRNPEDSLFNNLTILTPKKAVSDADVTLLSVPDDAVHDTCNSLAKHFKHRSIVAHCSGALDSHLLDNARLQGCYTCSVHPLNTFPNPESGLQLLSNNHHNTYLYCEGQRQALDPLQQLFKELGFNLVEINVESKPLYHAACVFACNYLTVLMDLSLQTAEAANLNREMFWKSIQPLIQSTLNNISEHGTALALSGPVARADNQTVQQHIKQLELISQGLHGSYVDLAVHAAQLALQTNTLNKEKTTQLNELLNLITDKS